MATRTTIRRFLVVAAALALAAPCVAADPEIEAIPYFHRVSGTVAVSGQPTPEQIAALAKAGFRTVINLRPETEFSASAEEQAAADAGLFYVSIPFVTAKPSNVALEEFLRVSGSADVYPVLIHCATANRASAFWLVRRVLRDGWTIDDAEKEARANGLTHESLRQFALEYVEAHPVRPAPGR